MAVSATMANLIPAAASHLPDDTQATESTAGHGPGVERSVMSVGAPALGGCGAARGGPAPTRLGAAPSGSVSGG
jgi:hypothetical protein